jgi:multidrug transporter EmrE-like cation transporter
MTFLKKIKHLMLLHLAFLFMSTTGILSKFSAAAELFSPKFFLCYGLSLLVLLIYSGLWQQILRRLPLNIAFAHRGAVTLWGIIWGAAIFGEKITVGGAVALALILSGIAILGVING